MKKQRFLPDIPAFYHPQPVRQGEEIILSEEETRHAHVLRLTTGSTILLLDGKGNRHHATINTLQKRKITAEIIDTVITGPDREPNVTLGIGILGDKTRMEWCVEKAVELGIRELYPLMTEHTEGFFPHERAQRIAIAALKQSQRTLLPPIHEPTSLESILHNTTPSDKIFICHEQTSPDHTFTHIIRKEQITPTHHILLLIGPEGGFSDTELQAVTAASGTPVSLGTTRLRAETAAIAGLALLNNHLETIPTETRQF